MTQKNTKKKINPYIQRESPFSFLEYILTSNDSHNQPLRGFYLPDRHCARCFPHILTFHSHNSPTRLDMILFSFHKWENRGLIRLTGLPRGPGLVAKLGLEFRCDSNIHFCKQELLQPLWPRTARPSSHGTCILHHPFFNLTAYHKHILILKTSPLYKYSTAYLAMSLTSENK